MVKKLTRRERFTLILCCVLVLIIAALLGFWLASHDGSETAPPAPAETFAPQVIVEEREKIVEVERVISAEIMEDGLRDMGVLMTGEYSFTEVVSFSKVSQLWGMELGFTESSYLCSYDGVVTAGVDLSALRVEKDEDTHIITVTRPAAAIQSIDIDPESFALHAEKISRLNPLSAADFNDSLRELENNAAARAVEKGLLTRADSNADKMIRQFVGGLADLSVYELRIVTE